MEISYYLFYENQFNRYLWREEERGERLTFLGGGWDQFIVLGGLMFVDFMNHSYPGIYIPTDELIWNVQWTKLTTNEMMPPAPKQ